MTKVRPMVAWSTGAVTVLIGLNELGLEAGVLDFRYEFSDDWSIATFLGFPRGASAAGPCACFYAVGLRFVAFGSCCPFGQSDYRTEVSGLPRLRKNVSNGGVGRGSCGAVRVERALLPACLQHRRSSGQECPVHTVSRIPAGPVTNPPTPQSARHGWFCAGRAPGTGAGFLPRSRSSAVPFRMRRWRIRHA